MNGQKNASPVLGGILYGLGGLSAMTEVVFLLQFLQTFVRQHGAALVLGVVLGLVLSVLVMPLIYALVNGNTAIATGRYHIPLVVSGLLGVLSYVLLLGTGGGSAGAQTFALIGLIFVYSLSRQTFWYIYFSIGQRFDRSGVVRKIGGAFSVVSALAAALVVLLFSDGTRDGVRAVTALAAIVAAVGVLAVYFVTAPSIPQFIRLEPHHKRSVKDTYLRFVAPLKNRAVLFGLLAAFFTFAGGAFAAATLPAAVLGGLFGVRGGFKPAVLIMALALTSASAYALTSLRGRKTGALTAIVLTSVLAAVATVSAVLICVPVPKAVRAVLLFALVALGGITLGFALAGEVRHKRFAAGLCGSTRGRYACLHGCIAVLGIALGGAFAVIVRTVNTHFGYTASAVAAMALTVALFVAATIVKHVGQADKYWNTAEEEQAKEAQAAEDAAPAQICEDSIAGSQEIGEERNEEPPTEENECLR